MSAWYVCLGLAVEIFFVKQKTAYEMRISDWSSDVCSSDLDATRNGLAETTDLYATFMRNGRELGITQDQAAKATETFAKTLKISGAGAAEASSATTQFSQALASGVLRGDEFNGIMESSPRLARLLADSLDVPVGSLRAMAEQGELTADKSE